MDRELVGVARGLGHGLRERSIRGCRYQDTYSGSPACGWDPWESEVYHWNLEHLGITNFWWWPEQARLASSQASATPLGGCTPEACRWQVQGTDTYDFRSTVGGDDCNCGIAGTGGATVTWSFVVESRVPQPEAPPPAGRL